jgi:hypothetical protein
VWAGRAAGRPDGAGAEAGARPIRDQVVGRRADDRDFEACKQVFVLGVRCAAEADRACEIGLFTVRAPTLEWIDHPAII